MVAMSAIIDSLCVLAPVVTMCVFLVSWKSRGQGWPLRRRKRLWLLPNGTPGWIRSLLDPAMSLARWARVSPGLLGMVGVAGLLAAGGLVQWAALAVGGYALLFPLIMIRDLRRFRHQLEFGAAMSIAQDMNPKQAEAKLLNASRDPEPLIRLASVHGLEILGTDAALATLETMTRDGNRAVAAQARLSHGQVMLLMEGQAVEEGPGFLELIESHRFWMNQLRREDSNPDEIESKVLIVEAEMDRISRQSLNARRSYPHLFCLACLTRARLTTYQTWTFVHCRHCNRTDLLELGVQRVVGEIGGVSDWELQDGVMRLGLWDEERRLARAADLDALHIHGGQNLNYDWAIAAIFDKMEGFHSELPEVLPTELINAPTVSSNSIALLRTLSPRLDLP